MVVAFRLTRRRQVPSTPMAPADPFRSVDDDADALRGDPRRIAAGDMVEVRGVSYAVRGTVRFTEGSWSWSEHLLDDVDGAKVWLSVEEDPDLELVLWRTVPETPATSAPPAVPGAPAVSAVLAAQAQPGADTITYGGRSFRREESGRARFSAAGTTGLHPSGVVRYHDYRAPDGLRLSFESYGDDTDWELGLGEQLRRGELMIYPRAAQQGQAG